jgi:hypothetical protein
MYGSKRVLACVMLGLSLVASSVSAGIINRSTSTTLFYDDFESATDISHHAYFDYPGDFDPIGGAPGAWTINEQHAPSIQVTDSREDGAYGPQDPGAYQGNNYMRIMREIYTAQAIMNIAAQETTGQQVHFEQMLWLGSSGALATEITSDCMDVFAWNGNSVGYYTTAGGVGILDGLAFVAEKWQKWELDYTIGDSTYIVTIDGVSRSAPTVSGAGSSLTYFLVTEGYGVPGPLMMDEVPEPSTLIMLGLGLVGLLAYAWCKTQRRR